MGHVQGCCGNFYPRPPRGGRHRKRSRTHPAKYFYPRPPRGGRLGSRSVCVEYVQFLSTPSARRATYGDFNQNRRSSISIHALREEGDATTQLRSWKTFNFYPRPPRGGRPAANVHRVYEHDISIHALREEGDLQGFQHPHIPERFLSTPSARRATWDPDREDVVIKISIHALREEGDSC